MLSGALWRRGGKRKESLQLRLWNLNICIEKVDAKCWLAEMTLVMTSLPLALDFRCLFTFALVSASRWLAEIWQLSRRGATGELELEFKLQRRSCKLLVIKTFFRAEVKMTLGLVHASYSFPYMHIFLCLFVAHSFIHYLTHSFVYSFIR